MAKYRKNGLSGTDRPQRQRQSQKNPLHRGQGVRRHPDGALPYVRNSARNDRGRTPDNAPGMA